MHTIRERDRSKKKTTDSTNQFLITTHRRQITAHLVLRGPSRRSAAQIRLLVASCLVQTRPYWFVRFARRRVVPGRNDAHGNGPRAISLLQQHVPRRGEPGEGHVRASKSRFSMRCALGIPPSGRPRIERGGRRCTRLRPPPSSPIGLGSDIMLIGATAPTAP